MQWSFTHLFRLFQILSMNTLGFAIELWNKLGEAKLCSGNKHANCLLILYTCLRMINFWKILILIIEANAALQCYVGLCSISLLRHRAVSHFWKLVIKEKSFFSSEEK
ncbi:hypothetical protein C2G38_2227958 [Gigaspora rosea]|uniref:Uncharacterized protein n=1 Tax=Gigaspora rosea TaxID=44941 RepID=A0A397TWH1_9GLOM|nr:hypothetical protein C2G38_2227958 [Gigaspora rosea]